MNRTQDNVRSVQLPVSLRYYGWFLMALPLMFVVGVATAIFVMAHNAADDQDRAAVTVTVEPGRPRPVEVDSLRHSCYPVGGQRDERKGGFGPSANYPKHMTATDTFGEPTKLSIVVARDETAHIGTFSGLHVRIVNRFANRVLFPVVDSQLYLVQEAIDESGEWRAIEESPGSTGPPGCGNSYHNVSLKPGEFWELAAPRYAGPFPTKLRFRLDFGRPHAEIVGRGSNFVYSSEFEGSINPRQLKRPKPH